MPRIELKSWTDRYLATVGARKTIGRQLSRDTAILGRENIMWVFDSAKASREEVIAALARAIEEAPFLRATWLGPDRDVRALLANLVEMF